MKIILSATEAKEVADFLFDYLKDYPDASPDGVFDRVATALAEADEIVLVEIVLVSKEESQ